MPDVELTRFRANHIPLEHCDIIAHFDCRVGEFHIRNCSLRVAHGDGKVYASLPGRSRTDISIDLDGEVRPAIFDAVCQRYRERTGRWPG